MALINKSGSDEQQKLGQHLIDVFSKRKVFNSSASRDCPSMMMMIDILCLIKFVLKFWHIENKKIRQLLSFKVDPAMNWFYIFLLKNKKN